ncbi:MAG TPA: tetratricopeptide repeat protein [Sphingomicrobium sp.]|nr:tetratricopeptide repeat protein [Sphingomicrobium sp.]
MIGGKISQHPAVRAVACLALAGCSAQQSKLEVRAIADPAAKIRQNGGNLGEAQAMLRLGNPGTALEAFRKVQRETPSAEALSGIAQCYVAMGRYDLARSNFEAALAYAPNSPEILTHLAAVLDRQGNAEAARVARADAILASAEAEPVQATDPKPVAEVSVAKPVVIAKSPGSVTLALPPATSSITVALPPARPAAPRSDEHRFDEALAVLAANGPRLERVSPGEVALVTTAAPLWARLEPRLDLEAKLKPPPDASRAKARILVLNAARTHRLAATARSLLKNRGWRRIDIGDAAQVRSKTLVLYPSGQAMLGRALAAQLGVAAAVGKGDRMVVLVGRDKSALARSARRA